MSPAASWLLILSMGYLIYLGASLLYIDSLKTELAKKENK
jgi:hypothetical protein